MKIIGLMTGTSADSLDGALVELTPEGPGLGLRLLGFREHPFDDPLRTDIVRLTSYRGYRIHGSLRARQRAYIDRFASSSLFSELPAAFAH